MRNLLRLILKLTILNTKKNNNAKPPIFGTNLFNQANLGLVIKLSGPVHRLLQHIGGHLLGSPARFPEII